MGFSVSATTVVLLLASLIAFGTFQAAVFEGNERRAEAVDAVEEQRLERANAAVVLAAVDYNATSGRLVVRVNNTGGTALSVDEVDLLVDNAYTDAETRVGGSATTDLWLPGETLVLETTVTDVSRVRVVTGPGVVATGAV